MKKVFVICVVVVVCGLGLIFYLLPSSQMKESLDIPLNCDLNLKDCETNYKGKKVIFSISPRPLKAMKDLNLKVSGIDCKDLSAKIYGLSMNMGTIKSNFIEEQNGICNAKIILSSCTSDVMRYRVELLKDSKPIDVYSDLDLILNPAVSKFKGRK